jgi:hypothetical protein
MSSLLPLAYCYIIVATSLLLLCMTLLLALYYLEAFVNCFKKLRLAWINARISILVGSIS